MVTPEKVVLCAVFFCAARKPSLVLISVLKRHESVSSSQEQAKTPISPLLQWAKSFRAPRTSSSTESLRFFAPTTFPLVLWRIPWPDTLTTPSLSCLWERNGSTSNIATFWNCVWSHSPSLCRIDLQIGSIDSLWTLSDAWSKFGKIDTASFLSVEPYTLILLLVHSFHWSIETEMSSQIKNVSE